MGSSTIKRYGLVGVSAALLEEVVTEGWGGWELRTQMLKPCPVWQSFPAAYRTHSSLSNTISASMLPCFSP